MGSDASTQQAQAQAAPAADGRPWRQRHPRRARLLLYGALALMLVAAFFAWREARQRYLWARVEQVSLVVGLDASGVSALQALDEEFTAFGPLEPLLQDRDLRAREARMRALIEFLRQDRPAMEAAFARAAGLDPEHVRLTGLERAMCLLRLGDAEAALAALPQPLHLPGEGWARTIWAMFVHAQAQDARGAGVAARAALRAALATLPRPLPTEEALWMGLAPISPAGAALEATRWLLSGPEAGTPDGAQAARLLWQQLIEVGGRDLEALVAAAVGLQGLGDEAGAKSAILAARRAHPTAAEAKLKQEEALKDLLAK